MDNEVKSQEKQQKVRLVSDTVDNIREKTFQLCVKLKLDNTIVGKIGSHLNVFSQPIVDSVTSYIDQTIQKKLERYIQIRKTYANAQFRQNLIAKIIDFFIRSMQEIDPTLIEESAVFQKIQEHEVLYEQSIPHKNNEELAIVPLQSLFSKQLSLPDRIKLLMLLVNEQARYQIEKLIINHPVIQFVDKKYQVLHKLKEIKTFYLVLNDVLNELVVEPIIKTLDYQRAAIVYYAQPVIDRVKKSFTFFKLQIKLCKNQIIVKAIQTKEFIVLSFKFKLNDVFNHFKKVLKSFIHQTFNVPTYIYKSYIYCGVQIKLFAEKYILLFDFIVKEFEKFTDKCKQKAVQIASDMYSEALKAYKYRKKLIQIKYNIKDD
ncbi:hypothetical protein ABPG74_011177 [Tetrahymena malaccensis]